jgi:hypothetical protein
LTKHHSPGSCRSTRTQLTSGTSSRFSSPATPCGPGNGEAGTR